MFFWHLVAVAHSFLSQQSKTSSILSNQEFHGLLIRWQQAIAVAQGRGRLRFLPKEKRKLAHNHYVPLHSYYHDSTLFKSVKLGSDMVCSQGYGVFMYLFFNLCKMYVHQFPMRFPLTQSYRLEKFNIHKFCKTCFFQGLESV